MDIAFALVPATVIAATVIVFAAVDSDIPIIGPPADSSDGSWAHLSDSGNIVVLIEDIPVGVGADADAAWPRIPDERSNRQRQSRRWRSDDGVPSWCRCRLEAAKETSSDLRHYGRGECRFRRSCCS